ncbi:MAG: hypothetical protein R3D85_15820 [Paracoccaceae bacterium]
MEALLILFAPLIEIVMMPVLALAGALLGAAVELVFWLLALIFGGAWAQRRDRRKRRGGGVGAGDLARTGPKRPLIPRRLLHWGAGALVLLGARGSRPAFCCATRSCAGRWSGPRRRPALPSPTSAARAGL